MSRMVASGEIAVGVAYHGVVLCDSEVDEDGPLPNMMRTPWLGVGSSTIFVESKKDIGSALFCLEQWDAPPPPSTDEPWSAAEVVTLTLPSGQLCVRQIAQGQIPDVWDVGGPGRFHVRVAWREVDEWDPESEEPEAFLHAQFWPATDTSVGGPSGM